MKATKSRMYKKSFYEMYIKRLIDVICSIAAIIILSPLMLLTAVLVRVKLGSPIIFVQERPGLNEKIFKLYKFRTMTDRKGNDGELLEDVVRLTSFGSKLRSTSLDELPELFNILKGDMSIVGPRPLMVEYLPYYTEAEKHRHDVRPGLTGLAQVNGRSFISWEEIFALDLKYISKVSFIEDMKIMMHTVNKVLFRKNIADVTRATKDSNGQLHYMVEGKDMILHQPMSVERGSRLW